MLRFDEIRIGSDIPVNMQRLVTQEKINKWAEVSVDFNPIHVDPEFAEKSQFGSTICHGTLTITFLMEMLTRWMGKGWLSGGQLLGVRFMAPVRPGDTVQPKGKVVNKREEKGKKLVECDIWLENQDGVKVIMGKAVAEVG